ncbi:TetR/AcrR family transcriptional regulator [Calidithermus chliarophilus]|uniref:TetR/AcrR family transcriptional regulator n=1 Tax=Calidithermus chliarophilus TaxID=52023 RepID=UPI000406D731|nr:TetR/AcrR family transcriptional regulator [Calidithermus chliarophilus]
MPYPAKTSPEAILGAALELLEHGGEDGLSLRALAGRLGVKAPSLYRHYPDKTALEVALVEHGNRRLGEALVTASQEPGPEAALGAAARAYLEFARTHPRLYDLMMDARLSALASRESGKAVWATVLRLVGALTRDPDDTAAAVALWSFLHGYAGLERSGMFGASGPKGGLEAGLRALAAGFKARAG